MPYSGLIILILLVAFPLLEIALLIKVGAGIGIWAVLGIVIGTAVLGMTVFTQQGRGVARRAVDQASAGEPPVVPLVESALLAFAGGCLIAPGLITDAVGLALLVPTLRQLLARTLVARGTLTSVRVSRWQRTGGTRGASGRAGETIEGQFERIEERDLPPSREPSRRDDPS